MDGEDDWRRRQTTSKGLNTRVPFDFRDLGRLPDRSARLCRRWRSWGAARNPFLPDRPSEANDQRARPTGARSAAGCDLHHIAIRGMCLYRKVRPKSLLRKRRKRCLCYPCSLQQYWR
jgi:hypothetical protein